MEANKDDVIDGRRLGVEPICTMLQVAPKLVKLHAQNYGVYGARKLWKVANRVGMSIGRDQTARLMRHAGLEGVLRRKKIPTTTCDPAAPTAFGSGPSRVHRGRAESALAHRSELGATLGRCGLRLLHHRWFQPGGHTLAGCFHHAHRDGVTAMQELKPYSTGRRNTYPMEVFDGH